MQKDGKTLIYLHVYDWPASGQLEVLGLESKIERAHLLGNEKDLAVSGAPGKWILQVPSSGSHEVATVIKLEINEEPVVEIFPNEINEDGKLILLATDAQLKGEEICLEQKEGSAIKSIGYWLNPESTVSWTVNIPIEGSYQPTFIYSCEKGSEGSEVAILINQREVSRFVVESTHQWNQFRGFELPPLQLDAGVQTVTLRPISQPGVGIMNLRLGILQLADRPS